MTAAWRLVAAVFALVVYALLSNWLMVHHANAPWTVALLFGPLLLAVAGMGWAKRQWLLLAGCVAGLLLLVVLVLRGGVQDAQRLYLLQHAGIHAVLACTFALTLRPGDKPLITALAEGLHGRLGQTFTPELALYTRGVTQLWTGYFGGMVLLSVALYALAPWAWWSLFCTVLTPVSAGLLFIAEYIWRYRQHPDFPRVTMRAAFDAYQQSGRTGAAP